MPGSAHVWEDEDHIPKKATNLVAIELTRNIIEAIKIGEHHSVYCIIPMYPEGDPTTMAVSFNSFFLFSAMFPNSCHGTVQHQFQ